MCKLPYRFTYIRTVYMYNKLQKFQNGPTGRWTSYLIASHISVPFTCTISHGHFKTGLQADVQATLSLRISVPFTCTTPPPPPPHPHPPTLPFFLLSCCVKLGQLCEKKDFVHRLSPVLSRHSRVCFETNISCPLTVGLLFVCLFVCLLLLLVFVVVDRFYIALF